MTDSLDRLKAALADRYRIEREIGSGGMATVYLAEDLKHDRQVAVKVLRPELAAVLGAGRFLSEIKVTANLQHPHILPLHDSGEADGFLFYVMPFVAGESLRAKLDRERQISVDEAVGIAKSVSKALDYAHRHGVIHRDIKPANILLHDGQPLVADFGIALAVRAAGGARLTETGLSLGTPAYMSPEQAAGDREVDVRTDIYSVGSVLYEMLVGEPPHVGPTVQAVIAKLLTEKPRPVTELRDTVPEHVAASVHRALEKLPADRFEDAAKFADALADPSFALPKMGAMAVGPARRSSQVNPLTIVLAGVAVALAGLLMWVLSRPEPPKFVGRFALTFSATPPPVYVAGGTFALFPDGSGVVYVGRASAGTTQHLYFRRFDEFEGELVPGSERAFDPEVSPDGQSLAFSREGTLWTVPLGGGPPLAVTDSLFSGGSWGPDGHIYGTHRTTRGIARIPATGGVIESITTPDALLTTHRFPRVTPNGRGAVFTVTPTNGEGSEIAVVEFESREVRTLTQGFGAIHVASGHLVFTRGEVLYGAPFDQEKLELTGAPVPLVNNVSSGAYGIGVGVAGNGTLLFTSFGEDPEGLFWVSRDGREEQAAPDTADFERVAISPDGRRFAAIAEIEDRGHVYLFERDTGVRTKFTFDGVNDDPSWTPDGRWITFSSIRGNAPQAVYRRPADGSGPSELLFTSDIPVRTPMWSPDGEVLVLRGTNTETGSDVLYLNPDRDTMAVEAVATGAEEVTGTVSFDGRWLAYVSDESGDLEVWVQGFRERGGKWQISEGGGVQPRWAHNGRELFFRGGPLQDMMVVDIATDSTFSRGIPRKLFDGSPYEPDVGAWSYDVAPDDQRFLMFRDLDRTQTVFVVLNFFEELKEKVGR